MAAATERIPLMTYVTCPIMRYHPVVVAQKAATVALLAGDGRFCLGLGAGENLNEHVIGAGWPPVNVRHEMLGGGSRDHRRAVRRRLRQPGGAHYRVDSAKLWDCPDHGVPIAVAVSGKQSVDLFAPVADAMVAVEPLPELVQGFDAAAGRSLPKIGQMPISWGPDRGAAIERAHDQFRWFAGGWKVNAELPGTAAFAAATQFVTPDDVAAAIPCGPDVAAHVEAVRPFVEAGFTHLALAQIGGDTQPDYLTFAERELLPALREEYGKTDAPAIRVR